MSPLACLAKNLGYSVQGSDSSPSEHILNRLTSMGIPVMRKQEANNIHHPLIIIRSSAISEDNPEIKKAREIGLSILHRAELLAHFMKQKKSIAVSGTHGKTTITCLITWLLEQLRQDPGMIAGSALMSNKSSWKKGSGAYFVAEADESDGSFLHYSPFIGIINNIDQDHLDFYENKNVILKAFEAFANKISSDGCLIICTDQAECADLFHRYQGYKISYGLSPHCQIRAISPSFHENGSSFTLITTQMKKNVSTSINLNGYHGVQNSLAALAAIKALGLDINKAASYLSSFPGVYRRMSLVFKNKWLSIFDDYAHNPGKISACLQSFRLSNPNTFLIVIFQPHRYSRLQTMIDEFSVSFSDANQVFVLPVFSAGEPHDKIYTEIFIADKITRGSNTISSGIRNLEEIFSYINTLPRQNTAILSLGAGNNSTMLKHFISQLEESLEPDS